MRPASYLRPSILGVAMWLCLATSAGAQESEVLLQRFLAHMNSNGPIAGEFEIRTSFDQEIRDRERQQLAQKNEAGKKLGQREQRHNEDQLLICRWAYDRDREMSETLRGSKNIFKSFYYDREASCVGETETSYNLDKPKRIANWRPAAFYFVSGMMERWTELLPDFKERAVIDAPPGSPENAVVLVLRRPKTKHEIRLLLHRETAELFGSEGYFSSALVARLTIYESTRNHDGRVFPKRAEHSVFLPASQGRPFRTDRLVAKSVVFPTSQQETENAFALTLPKGALIADRLLNRGMKLEQPTNVQTIIRGHLPSRSFDNEGPIALPEPVGRSASHYWIWIGLLTCIAAIALIGIVVRQRRMP